MAIKNEFIDNLRKAMDSIAQQGTQWRQSHPIQDGNISDQDRAARGTMFHRLSDDQAQRWQNSKYEAAKITAMPRTEKDWRAFTDGLSDFRVVMDSYSREPNQDARIRIIEQSAPRFQNSEKLARYLTALHENELANKRGELSGFNYREQPAYLEQSINEVLAHRYKRA